MSEKPLTNDGVQAKSKPAKRANQPEVGVFDTIIPSDKTNSGQGFAKKSSIKWTQTLGGEIEVSKFD